MIPSTAVVPAVQTSQILTVPEVSGVLNRAVLRVLAVYFNNTPKVLPDLYVLYSSWPPPESNFSQLPLARGAIWGCFRRKNADAMVQKVHRWWNYTSYSEDKVHWYVGTANTRSD